MHNVSMIFAALALIAVGCTVLPAQPKVAVLTPGAQVVAACTGEGSCLRVDEVPFGAEVH